ncbi:peroxisome proliferator-activated receptor gamma coactivator-related protein 1 [Gadus morhua]|uniref:PPARG related coactivator 1 n=1 Tax=Gadus morhua TaxID=8049 RepID=A0A8C5D195_GADMO|nr:peroxisome proliferator-activated receptor gamma coactivator-related protein 1 [Gadus morhua]
MAARWGAGEELLTACNLDYFATDTLHEDVDLDTGETLEAFEGCLGPSILSMFEDVPTGEVKGLDDESEATLLTALTEILDNVDDETLSPFDMLPDSDLLSGQRAREHSPLRRLLCLSRSPPEKDTICNMRTLSSGKSLPRPPAGSVQRSDGEEEDDGSLSQSPTRLLSSPDQELLDWGGLSLPLPFSIESEDDTEGLSVSLGDLVRHMHPYCMAVCVDNGEGEQMLPEGGILLEVVDQGEHGEPILAIPDLGLPLALLQNTLEMEQHVPDESDRAATESCEEIVVDDTTTTGAEMKAEIIAASVLHREKANCERNKKHKAPRIKEIREKSPPRRKRDRKVRTLPEPVEGRILRSGVSRNAADELQQKLKKTIKVKKSVPLVTDVSDSTCTSSKHKSLNACQKPTEVTKLSLPRENRVNTKAVTARNSVPVRASPVRSPPSRPIPTVALIPPSEGARPAASPTKQEVLSPAVTAAHPIPGVVPVSTDSCSSADAPTTPEALQTNGTADQPAAPEGDHVPAAAPEPKPKSLSLAEYRRLRQQKKPAPIEKQEGNSTRWPSLQEPPKELPPIPCLPDPSPQETRRPAPASGKKEVEEVKPAWQPTGPGAPPTPEALLAPPAYMVASSTKAGAATLIFKRQQQSVPHPPQHRAAAAGSSPVKSSSPGPQPNASPEKPCVPRNSVPTPTPCSKPSESKPARPPSQPVTPSSLVGSAMPAKATSESLRTIAAPMSAKIAANANAQVGPKTPAATSGSDPVAAASKFANSAGVRAQPCLAVQASNPSQDMKALPVKAGAQQYGPTSVPPMKKKTASQALIEAFTSEIGIEAADLTSLLEQFEETQAKEKRCVPEVSGRAVTVGNSSVVLPAEKTAVERVKANDLSSSAALTPPATPPQQRWKPLAPVSLLGKSRASRPTPTKVIRIEAQPLPSVKGRSTPATLAPAPEWALMDHDYCLPSSTAPPGDHGQRWNVKQQPNITIRAVTQLQAATTGPPGPAPPRTTTPAPATGPPEAPLKKAPPPPADPALSCSALETPDASPARPESPRPECTGRSHRRRSESRSPGPRTFPKERKRGRSSKRLAPRPASSSESDCNSSRSRSRSPPAKKYRARHSESSSSSSSCSSRSSSRSPPRRRRYSYSSSRSGSWSRSRSRSRSPQRSAEWQRNVYSPSYRPTYRHTSVESSEDVKRRKQQAIDERRVVYVGRIRGTMTQNELRERFSIYGEIEDCTLHFREQGDNYGFVTYYDTKNAFTAIENGGKLRKPDELPFDLCFGGRRQFCKTSYADLDSNKEYDSLPSKGKFHALDFDTLLKQAKKTQKR